MITDLVWVIIILVWWIIYGVNGVENKQKRDSPSCKKYAYLNFIIFGL